MKKVFCILQNEVVSVTELTEATKMKLSVEFPLISYHNRLLHCYDYWVCRQVH